MSSFNWCHGPHCHTNDTQDRLRGVQGSKVLRTRKVAKNQWNSGVDNEGNDRTSMYSYFCSQGCYNDFANTYVREVIALHPRTEALETPVDVQQVKHPEHYNGHYTQTAWTETKIITVDNNGG